MEPRQTLDQGKRVTTFFDGDFNAEVVVVLVCSAVALYNAMELFLLILTTFRRYSGLYFYSLLISSLGIIPYTCGYLIGYFQLCDQLAGLVVSTIGWPAMVTGQSLVLFSRLGILLIPEYAWIHRCVKWAIVIDAVVFHVSTTVAFFGAFEYRGNDHFILAYRYIEKIQMTGFTIQEFILSGIYIWRTLHILKTTTMAALSRKNQRKRVMIELLSINIWIILMDMVLLTVEYQNRHVFEQALKGVVYSVKLKLEFAILNKLVAIVDAGARHSGLQDLEFITTCTKNDLESRRTTVDSSIPAMKTAKADEASHIERLYNTGNAIERQPVTSG